MENPSRGYRAVSGRKSFAVKYSAKSVNAGGSYPEQSKGGRIRKKPSAARSSANVTPTIKVNINLLKKCAGRIRVILPARFFSALIPYPLTYFSIFHLSNPKNFSVDTLPAVNSCWYSLLSGDRSNCVDEIPQSLISIVRCLSAIFSTRLDT